MSLSFRCLSSHESFCAFFVLSKQLKFCFEGPVISSTRFLLLDLHFFLISHHSSSNQSACSPSHLQIDSLLYRLAGSPNLNILELDDVDFSVAAFGQLKRCPHLVTLMLKKVLVSDDVIEAIGQFPSLKSVTFDEVKLTDSQIASLVRRKDLLVILQAPDYIDDDMGQDRGLWNTYKVKYPTVVFR